MVPRYRHRPYCGFTNDGILLCMIGRVCVCVCFVYAQAPEKRIINFIMLKGLYSQDHYYYLAIYGKASPAEIRQLALLSAVLVHCDMLNKYKLSYVRGEYFRRWSSYGNRLSTS